MKLLTIYISRYIIIHWKILMKYIEKILAKYLKCAWKFKYFSNVLESKSKYFSNVLTSPSTQEQAQVPTQLWFLGRFLYDSSNIIAVNFEWWERVINMNCTFYPLPRDIWSNIVHQRHIDPIIYPAVFAIQHVMNKIKLLQTWSNLSMNYSPASQCSLVLI